MVPGSAPALATAMAAEAELAEVRFARGCRCFAAWEGADVIAYGWLSRRPEWIGEVRLEIAPAAADAYVWNCVTLPGHRRRGLFRALLVFICARSREESRFRLWIASAGGGAEKAVVDAGFSPVLALNEQRLAGWRRLAASGAPGSEPDAVAAARAGLALGRRTVIGRRPAPRVH